MNMDAIDNTNINNIEDITALSDFPESYKNIINTQPNYQKLFEGYFERHKPALDAYDLVFSSSDPDAAADHARATASVLIEKEHSKIESTRKWNKNIVLSADAMLFVTFLIPAVVSYKAPSTDALADAIVTVWNETFPKSKISKSDYNTIFSGFRKSGIGGLFGFR